MLTLIMVCCALIAFLLFKLAEKCTLCDDVFCIGVIGTVFSAGVIVCIVILFVLLGQLLTSYTIDEQLQMYTDENAAIETRIENTVNNYLKYEQSTYEKMKAEDPVAIVAAYPELNSSAIVQEQIQTYNDNNQKIKEIKEKKINLNKNKFWLYFGR